MPAISDLNVCFLAGTLDRGGAEQQLWYMLKALRLVGANLHLLSLQSGGFWHRRIHELNVPITHVGANSRLKRFARIAKVLQKIRPAIFQSQHFYTNAYVAAAARLRRIPSIGAMRSNGESEVRACGRFLGALCLRLPDFLAANSRAALNYALSRGISREKQYFLPNVVDTEQFRPTERKRSNDVIRLVCAGRLVREKRFDRFLRVLANVRNTATQPVRGLVVTSNSSPNALRELKEQAAQLSLLPEGADFIEGTTDMASVYEQADICVLTSDFEGTPNVLLEAMACGLPVVATRVGGVPDLVADGETGCLANRDDEKALASALLTLVEKPGLRRAMGERARSYVETNHSFERLAVGLVNLYDLALPRKYSVDTCGLEQRCA